VGFGIVYLGLGSLRRYVDHTRGISTMTSSRANNPCSQVHGKGATHSLGSERACLSLCDKGSLHGIGGGPDCRVSII
jgi:hypothetical protein